jgi:hypothetical protein
MADDEWQIGRSRMRDSHAFPTFRPTTVCLAYVSLGKMTTTLTLREGIEFPIMTTFGSTRLLRVSP